jgi:hypothetical protein
MKIFFYIKRFLKISKLERTLLVSGFIQSGIFFILIRVFPLKTYLRYLISKQMNYKSAAFCQNEIKIANISINRLQRNVPWNFNCLNKALTSKFIFDFLKIKSEVLITIKKNENNRIYAHASIILKKDNNFFQDVNQSNLINFNATRYPIL